MKLVTERAQDIYDYMQGRAKVLGFDISCFADPRYAADMNAHLTDYLSATEDNAYKSGYLKGVEKATVDAAAFLEKLAKE